MSSKVIAIMLVAIIASGLIYTHPAFAHNFGGDESASWLAKVAEIKTEAGLVSKHVGDNDAIGYYSDALGEYWNANDTKEIGEKNTRLQQEIPATINATITDAAQVGNQNNVNSDVVNLGGYLDESVTARVDKDKLNNSTIQALAITFVLKESLEKYGNSVNSTTDLNDMSQMKMGDNMSSMAMTSAVINQNAYENSIGLATSAQGMFSDISAQNTDKSDANGKISSAFTKLLQDLNGKADVNTIMMDVHEGIHPGLIDAYNLPLEAHSTQSAVPEFPMPALLVIISITGVIVATRFKSRLGF